MVVAATKWVLIVVDRELDILPLREKSKIDGTEETGLLFCFVF